MLLGGQAADLTALMARQVSSTNGSSIATTINPGDDSVFLHVAPAEAQAIVAGLVYFSLWLGALGWDVVSTLGFDLMLIRNTNWKSIPSGLHSVAYMLSRYLNVAWICMAVITPIVRSDDCHVRAVTSATLFALGLDASGYRASSEIAGRCPGMLLISSTTTLLATLVFLLRTVAIWRLKPAVVVPLTISWFTVLALSVTLPINLHGVQLAGEWCTLDVSHITALGVIACVFVFDSMCLILTVLRLNRAGWRGLVRGLLPGMWLSSRRKQEEAYGEPEPSEDSVAVMLVERTVSFFSIQFVILISAVVVYYTTEQVAFRLMQIVACQAISAIMAGRLFRRAWFLTRQQKSAVARQLAQPSQPPSYSVRSLEDDAMSKFDYAALAADRARSPSLIRPSAAAESSHTGPAAATGSGIGDAPVSDIARRKGSKAALTAAALADEDLYVEGEFPKASSSRSLLLPKDSYTSFTNVSPAQRYAARHLREARSSRDQADDDSVFVPMDGTRPSAPHTPQASHRRQTLPATLRPFRLTKVSRQTIEDATRWPVGPNNYPGWWKTGGSARDDRTTASGRPSTDTSHSIYELPRRPVTSHTSSSRSSSSRNQNTSTSSADPHVFAITRQVQQPIVGRASAGPEVLRDALRTDPDAPPRHAASSSRRRRPATAPSQRDDLSQRPKRSILFIDSARARRNEFVASDQELAEFPLRAPRVRPSRDFVASPPIMDASRTATPRDRSAYDLDALKAAASIHDRARFDDALGSAPPSMSTFGATSDQRARRYDAAAATRGYPAALPSHDPRHELDADGPSSNPFAIEAEASPSGFTEAPDALFAFRQTIDDDAAEMSREFSRPGARDENRQRAQSSAGTDDGRPRTSRGGPLSAFGQPRLGTAESAGSRNDGRPTTSHGRSDELSRPLTGHSKSTSSAAGRFQRIPLDSRSADDLRGQAREAPASFMLPEEPKSAIAEQFERLAAAAARPSADFDAPRSSGSGEHEARSAVQRLSGLRPKLDRVSSDNVIESLDS